MSLKKIYFVFLFFILLMTSCSSIKLSDRKNKDSKLTNNDQLNGHYTIIDTVTNNNQLNGHDLLINNGNKVKIVKHDYFLKSLDDETIEFKYYKNGSIIKNEKLQGRLRRGYFKVKTEWDTEFIAGPLLWVLTNRNEYIGLTKENNLVKLSSGGGVMLFVLFPMMANGNQHELEYPRIK